MSVRACEYKANLLVLNKLREQNISFGTVKKDITTGEPMWRSLGKENRIRN